MKPRLTLDADREKQTILHWLQPSFDGKGTDPCTVHVERTKLREPGTCEWMTACAYWKDWLLGGSANPTGYRRFLWIHGLPGSGKTILVSHLNDEVALHCGANGCSYYYCLYEHDRDETETFLRHTIRDFCIQLGSFVPPKLHEMWKYKNLRVGDLQECLRVVTLEFLAHAGKRAYIIVDAVDESKSPRKGFLKVLVSIGTDPAFNHVSLLMTSREEPDIKQAIESLPQVPLSWGPGLSSSSSTFDIPVLAMSHPPNESHQLIPHPSWMRPASFAPFGNVPVLMPPKQRARVASEPPVSFGRTSKYHNDLIDLDMSTSMSALSTYSEQGDVGAAPNSPTKPSARNNKRQLSGPHESRSPSPQKRKVSAGGSHVDIKPEHELDDVAATNGSMPRVFPCSILSMSNPFVRAAIEKVIEKQLEASGRFGQWPREDFIPKLKMHLAVKAGGIFRAVACHLDLIARQQNLIDDDQILDAIGRFPETLFDQYEQIIVTGIPDAGALNSHNRDFARTALALACSDTAGIPDVVVLVEAARFNVPQGKAQAFNLEKLKHLLGCLVKVTRLRRKPTQLFTRNDDPGDHKRLSVAHFTVKEFLYHKKTAQGPARDFALSKETNRRLELKIVFYGLQQFLPERKQPTKYEEYCIKMTEKAISKQPAVLVRDKEIWEAVHRCLAWNDPHLNVVKRNKATREAFPNWNKLATAFVDGEAPEYRHTCIIVSLLLLEWPKLAEVYLGSLQDEQKEEIWSDAFVLRDSDATTVLEMCVSGRQTSFLDIFVQAGATFQDAEDILFRALEDPYSDSEGHDDDGSTTGLLLRTLLERGADPNAIGDNRWTPLQVATRQLEHFWVQELLYYRADPNAVVKHDGHVGDGEDSARGGGNGGSDASSGGKKWYHKTPIDICRTTIPKWGENEEDWAWSRSRVGQLLTATLANAGTAPANADVIVIGDD